MPVSPRLVNPSIPTDPETITLKGLEKDPSRRYQTARGIAASGYLNQQTVARLLVDSI